MNIKMSKDKVVEKNIQMHEKKADNYEEDNPEIFNSWEEERITSVLEEISDHIKTDSSKMRALDAGCGTGNVLRKLQDHFYETIGLDLSDEMLKVAEKEMDDRREYGLIRGKASDIPFPNNYFDAVTAYSLLHHVPNFEPVISEISRVLKDGGVLYIDHEPINREKLSVKLYIKWCDLLNGESHGGLPPYEETRDLEREYCDYHIHHGDTGGLPKSQIIETCKDYGFKIIENKKYLSYGSDQLNLFYPLFKPITENEWMFIGKKANI